MRPAASNRLPVLVRLAAIVGIVAASAVRLILGCGPYLTFRAYLTRTFWDPMHYMMRSFVPAPGAGAVPFAGYLATTVPAPLAELREAYRRLASPGGTTDSTAVQEAGAADERALATNRLTGTDLEEARLIDCKIGLRLAGDDAEKLAEVQHKLEKFIGSSPAPAFASEARGWLARTLYLQRHYVLAAKIYLDEVGKPESVLSRDTLVSSLRWVYSAGAVDFWNHPEEFFDTPRHALFIVNLITEPRRSWESLEVRRRAGEETGRKVLRLLQDHKGLFKSGPDSEALVLALMRTSFYLGDPASALTYAKSIPGSKSLGQNPEFQWMIAAARFIGHDYAGAEAPLLKMLRSPIAGGADRRTAAQALIGVYLKTSRPADALWAAFIEESDQSDRSEEDGNFESPRMQWCDWCSTLDLPYLLDARLTGNELREYLRKYPEPVGPPMSVFNWQQTQKFSAPQAVRYSLAVRLARQGEYSEAARLYDEVGAKERAGNTRVLAELDARARNTSLPEPERLGALYKCGAFMADMPDRLFFNDLFWKGFQREAFLVQYSDQPWLNNPHNAPGVTRKERETILADDRRLRDEQEERWQAVRVLERVAHESNDPKLQRKAALKILDALQHINMERFGRKREIRAAISRWREYLHSQNTHGNDAEGAEKSNGRPGL